MSTGSRCSRSDRWRNGSGRLRCGSKVAFGSRSCEKRIPVRVACCATPADRAGSRARSGRDRLHQRVDAEDVDHSLHIVGQHLQAHLGFDLFEGPGQKVTIRRQTVEHPVLPIKALSVPNGCSTVCRRIVMASGMWSSLACILSSTPSCSQRYRRLTLSGVHRGLSAQVRHAVRLR